MATTSRPRFPRRPLLCPPVLVDIRRLAAYPARHSVARSRVTPHPTLAPHRKCKVQLLPTTVARAWPSEARQVGLRNGAATRSWYEHRVALVPAIKAQALRDPLRVACRPHSCPPGLSEHDDVAARGGADATVVIGAPAALTAPPVAPTRFRVVTYARPSRGEWIQRVWTTAHSPLGGYDRGWRPTWRVGCRQAHKYIATNLALSEPAEDREAEFHSAWWYDEILRSIAYVISDVSMLLQSLCWNE